MYTKAYTTINASTKGAAIMRLLAEADEERLWTRKELAAEASCTPARVGEVLRALKDSVEKVGDGYRLVSDDHLPEVSGGRSVALREDSEEDTDEGLVATDAA